METREKDEAVYYQKQPEFTKKKKSTKLKQYINRGMSAFIVVMMSILFYFFLFKFEMVKNLLINIATILRPIIAGLVIAYMLNPIVKNVDKKLLPYMERKMESEKAKKTVRTIGISLSMLFLVLLVYALCAMMLPELYRSIRNLVYSLPRQINNAIDAINNFEVKSPELNNVIGNVINEGTEMIQDWFRNDMMAQINDFMSGLTIGVVNIFSAVFDILIGLIVAVYVLNSKDSFSSHCKKMTYAFLPIDKANLLLHITSKSNEMFSGFIIGKIIDSVIIGVICFVSLSILNMPYTLLVSVIVGVTNIIPFFGPFIGAIPSSILILLDDPLKGVYFIIFVVLLQQLDGNIIGPKILGDSTGLSSFWVITAILFCGGLFGVPGMIVGVPLFAVIFYVFEMITSEKLKEKKLPTEAGAYGHRSYVDNQGKYVNMEVTDEEITLD